MSLTVLEGLRPWVIQRVSAIIVAAYLVYIALCSLSMGDASYTAWRDWVYAPYNSLFMGLFILAILFHAWIGMRDVILDYIRNVMLRLVILSVIMIALMICGLWSLRILLIPLAA